MKNNETTKQIKNKHAVVVCYLFHKRGELGRANRHFNLDALVWFLPDGTKLIRRGRIVHINESNGAAKYIVVYGAGDKIEMSAKDLFISKAELLEANELHEFDCEVCFNQCSALNERVVAKTLDDAVEYLIKKYPEAYSVSEVDHWQ